MMPQIFQAIDTAVAQGVPPNMVGDTLAQQGWPPELIKQALESWMGNHGYDKKTTAFKDWVKKYHHRARPAVAAVVFLSLLQAGIALLKPWPTKILADSAFGNIPAPGPLAQFTHTSTLILITSLITVGLFVIGSLLDFVSSFALLKIGFWLNRSIKIESLRHILHLPLYHQERLAKGDYVYRQNVVTNSLSDLVLGTTASIIGSVVMILGVLIIMIAFNPKLTLISVVLMPLLYLTMKLFGPRMGKYSQKLTETASETSSRINEAVDNAETVQAFTLEDKQLGGIDKLWWQGYQYTRKSMLWSSLLENTNGFLTILATSTVMYFGGTAALHGQMSFGQLLIFMTYMGYLLNPIENLVKQITTRYQKLIDVNRIYEVLVDHEGIEDLRRDRHIPPQIRGVIDFQNVTYAYKNQIIFRDLNLHIQEGEKVAIIGPSGGGKSTILKLLPLFIEPTGGRVLIDGIDSQSVSLQELRHKIAWVSQSPQLFSGGIMDNMLDGDPNRIISASEVKNALMVSNVAEFAVKMPLGLDSPVGENGSSLSGGQRQRVAIARSLIKNAPILCLDEPTAALDVKSENYIRDSLMQMVRGKTVLMVTHRKALLALMDTIYVLEDGTLRNVKELGGLDHYLAVLEGINEQQAQKEIAKEQQGITADMLNLFIQAQKHTEEENSAHNSRKDNDIPPPPPPPTIRPSNDVPVGVGVMKEDGEVEIKLH
jgi:ABC-type bacteriocin/lantibiotic exporter with double-glycine peptidase domain